MSIAVVGRLNNVKYAEAHAAVPTFSFFFAKKKTGGEKVSQRAGEASLHICNHLKETLQKLASILP